MRGIFSPDVAIEEMDGSGGDGGAAAPAANGGGAAVAAAPPPFLSKTYDMVDDPATDAIVSWGPANNSFVVWSTPEFSRDLLPKYFKHNNFSSFVRQLNTYVCGGCRKQLFFRQGYKNVDCSYYKVDVFRKEIFLGFCKQVHQGFRKVDPDRWEFANEGFLRGQKHLLKTINRRKPSHVHSQPQQPQAQNSTVAACVEVGKFGLEEEIERLKRDKNVLMQELVRLRQQQQTTDHQLQTLGQRLQGMEQRQQQMMSFLAKAMQSPGFLAQLVQQNDSNRRITGVSKKRRFPKQGNELVSERSSPDGQIIKYQPLMNEAANAMLMQILKFDTSQRLDPLSNSDSFMLGNFSSSMEPIGSVNSSNRNSGVTLKEVPTSSGTQYLTASSASSVVPSTSALSEMQSSAGAVDMVTTSGGVQGATDQGLPGMNIPGQPGVQGMIPSGNIMNIPIENYGGTESGYIDPMSTVADGSLPIDMEDFAVDTDLSIPVDDEDQGLPSINDSFWEQFLQASDAEEVDSGNQEANEMLSEQENGWDSAQRMEHLTEQMGLLSPETKQ